MVWSRVIVMPVREVPRSDEILYWHALWEGEADPTAPLGEFDGPLEEAVGWAGPVMAIRLPESPGG